MTNDERRLTEIIGGLIDDIRLLLRDQVALAQAEVRRSVQAGVTALVLILAAGLLLALAALFAMFAATEGLIAAGLSRWAAYLLVAGGITVVGGVLAAVALRRSRAIGLTRTKAALTQTRSTIAEVIPSAAPTATDVPTSPASPNPASTPAS